MPALDGLRGLAMLMVLAHHLVVITPRTEPERLFVRLLEVGTHGIDIFFVLSGFLITGILLELKGKPRFFHTFYVRRTLRIFPAYYAMLAVVLLLLPALYRAGGADASSRSSLAETVSHWPWYVGYANNILFALKQSFLDRSLAVTWSLAVEEQFYLAWAVCAFFLSPLGLMRLCALMAVAALAFRIWLWQSGAGWIPIWVSTPTHLDALAAGAWGAFWLRRPGYRAGSIARPARLAFGIGLAACLALWFAGHFHHQSGLFLTVGYLPLIVTVTGALLALIHADPGGLIGRAFSGRFLRFFGKYSYAIYLVHMPIMDFVWSRGFTNSDIRGFPGPALLWQGAFHLLITGISVGVALLSWRFLEAPALALKDRWAPQEASRIRRI